MEAPSCRVWLLPSMTCPAAATLTRSTRWPSSPAQWCNRLHSQIRKDTPKGVSFFSAVIAASLLLEEKVSPVRTPVTDVVKILPNSPEVQSKNTLSPHPTSSPRQEPPFGRLRSETCLRAQSQKSKIFASFSPGRSLFYSAVIRGPQGRDNPLRRQYLSFHTPSRSETFLSPIFPHVTAENSQ